MTYRHNRRGITQMLGCALAVLVGVSTAWAGGPHNATLIKHDGGRASGEVRYLSSSRTYELKMQGGRATTTVPAADVARVVLQARPPGLSQAIDAVKRGQYAAAIAPLKQIKDDYAMFGPDVEAAQYLAIAYLGLGKSADAVRMCDEVLRENPEAASSGQFAGIYWDALLKEKQFAKLSRILGDAIKTGSRQVAAVALVKRGDIDMEQGEGKKALLDGYLRTILLFQDVKEIQPEALYKAIKAHEALNEHQYAEKWRKRLLSGYASSDYAKKLK
jgi:tetratricopeptide (TPR) repeat protein